MKQIVTNMLRFWGIFVSEVQWGNFWRKLSDLIESSWRQNWLSRVVLNETKFSLVAILTKAHRTCLHKKTPQNLAGSNGAKFSLAASGGHLLRQIKKRPSHLLRWENASKLDWVKRAATIQTQKRATLRQSHEILAATPENATESSGKKRLKLPPVKLQWEKKRLGSLEVKKSV